MSTGYFPNSKYAAGLRDENVAPNGNAATNGATPSGPGSVQRYASSQFGGSVRDPPLPTMSEEPRLHSRGLSGLGDLDSTPYRMPERRLSISSNYSRASEMLGNRGEALLGPRRPRPHKIWRKKYIKLLVVGDSGLGKTTLIKCLTSIPGERVQVHDGSYTPTEQFKRDPDSLCSMVSWRDEEDRTIWVYKIQDTPGYGDDLDVFKNLKMILDYIALQNNKWLEMEQSRDRKEDLAELEDPRVDVCLFCIPPHRLRPIDLKYMYELGLHVPVVPIVTKADTMTIREANIFRTEVASKIANPMLPGIKDKINVFKFERDTLERSGVTDQATPHPPFLVIASNDVNEEMSQGEQPMYWPERRYPWGTAEAFNKEHSDMLALRALLMKEALEEISQTKRQRYEDWRRQTLSGPKYGRKIFGLLMWTVVPAVICLQAGRRGIKMEDVQRVIKNNLRRVGVKRRGPAPIAAPPPPPPEPETVVVVEPVKKRSGWGL